jgi:hypothetical protein
VALDEHGRVIEPAGFHIAVDEAAADVVRRLFALYLGRAGLREIAHQLNADGIASPRLPRSRVGPRRGHQARFARCCATRSTQANASSTGPSG